MRRVHLRGTRGLNQTSRAVAIGACLVLAATAAGQSPEPAPEDELQLFELNSQLEEQVVSSTKVAQRGAQSPAVITVVRAEEIQARGYRSLAEILRTVPGFYDVYDLVTHNFGVRGINGGPRASGNILKLMIDGQPVDFRPTTGNFFGEELIPLQAISRVEILRGPASALYGANAFLGVVNVITRSGRGAPGLELLAQGALTEGHPGGGLGAMFSAGTESLEALVAAGGMYLDRSGLSVPDSSPSPVRGSTTGDLSRPRTFFGKASFDAGSLGKVGLMASLQQLDARGAFQDFGPLAPNTRIGLFNQNYRLTWDLVPDEIFSLKLSAHYFAAKPAGTEVLDIGRSDYLLLRSAGATGFGVAAEASVHPFRLLDITAGADVVFENNLLQTFDQLLIADVLSPDGSVLRSAGTVTPGEAHGQTASFRNVGAFLQGVLLFTESLSAIVGGRIDVHDLYGFNPTFRLGVVYAPPAERLSLKLLFGTSYKAPSAEQLYTQPMAFGDIEGNCNNLQRTCTLKAQTANTLELSGGWGLPNDRGELSANIFTTEVRERVEFVRRGTFLHAVNIPSERIAGLELDGRLALARPLQLHLVVGLSRTISRDSGALLTGVPEVVDPLFPSLQAHAIVDGFLPWYGLRLSGELSLIGPISASAANASANAGVAYTLPAHLYTAVTLSTAGQRLLGDRLTSAALRVSNLLNQSWAEPGFGGIDVPSERLTLTLTIQQEF